MPKMNYKSFKLIGIIFTLIVIIGISYSFYNYTRAGGRNEFVVGDIYMHYNTLKSLPLVNVVPRSDKDNNMYIEFTIDGLNKYKESDIWYGIDLLYGDVPENKTEQSRIRDDLLRFTLTKKVNNGPEVTVIDNKGYADINELRIYVETISKDTSVETSHTYKLYVWISDEIEIGNGALVAADYSVEEWNNIFASIKIRVVGDFIAKSNSDFIKVNFDADGGNISTKYKYYNYDDAFGTLPVPVKDGYGFIGWYNNDDELVTSSNAVKSVSIKDSTFNLQPGEIRTEDMYQYVGDYVFDGNNYIDTGIYLFNNQTSASKNFYLSFEIKSKNASQVDNAVLMGANDEDIVGNSGMFFRVRGNKDEYQIATRSPDANVNEISFSTEKVELLRLNQIIYYRLNGIGDFEIVSDMSSFTSYHDLPVSFGGGIRSDAVFRGFNGTLSNMFVQIISNDATLDNYENYVNKLGNYYYPDITLTAKWSPYVIFDKVTEYDVQNASYIFSYDDVISSNPTYATQDTIETNNNKKTVYYYSGADAKERSNVLFAGFCWQILRTTDTGSVKLLYNGVAEDNKCKTDRSPTQGINATGSGTVLNNMDATRIYGKSYDYDLSTGKFTIQDTQGLPTSWNDNTYKYLIGTYTCGDETTECNTLYYIGSYQSSTEAGAVSYTIGTVDRYSQMGTSPFNSQGNSLAMIGYMFNDVYNAETVSIMSYIRAGDVTWDSINNRYVLGSSANYNHYACNDSNCTQVRYYYYCGTDNGVSIYSYILLSNGKKIEDVLREMINNDDVLNENINIYNSSIKGFLDNWYKKNLTNYTKYLDTKVVYCNNRYTLDLGGWLKTNNFNNIIFFNSKYNGVNDTNLDCINKIDRFSMANDYAKLTYPIGLPSWSERALATKSYIDQYAYWLSSPSHFTNVVVLRNMESDSISSICNATESLGVRGVVTLRSDVKVSSGDGSYEAPYVIDTTN